MTEVKCPVRSITDFILRYGDINYVKSDNTAMEQGSKAHRDHQREQKIKYPDYKKEAAFSVSTVVGDFSIKIYGRADGVYTDDGGVWIEEIKCSLVSVDYLLTQTSVHKGQAMFYAYMYCVENNIEFINVILTYISMSDGEIHNMRYSFSMDELKTFFDATMIKYAQFLKMQFLWYIERNESIKGIKFPYPKLRTGQKTMMTDIYNTVLDDGRIYINAPTGIGKTLSGLYPAVKAMPACGLKKIFYLTAKTITATVAVESFHLMCGQGLKFKVLTLVAKEKICMLEKSNCDPEFCKYAKGHYDRINQAILDIFRENDVFNKSILELYAERYTVCPYELAGDLSLYADAVICDYNYVFDPVIYLKRFFKYVNEKNYVFLIDEAHNLPDRVREMFSAQINRSTFSRFGKLLKGGRKNFLKVSVNQIINYLKEQKELCIEYNMKYMKNEAFDHNLHSLVIKFIQDFDVYMAENQPQPFEDMEIALEAYFEALEFNTISQHYDEHFTTYVDIADGISERIFCIDTSSLITEALNRGKSAVLFSATLSPMGYFTSLTGGETTDKILDLPSPFNPYNLCLMINHNISVKFADRQNNIKNICGCIINMTKTKTGNYIIYFPSYGYMNDVYNEFISAHPEVKTIIQKTNMTEEERHKFLNAFECNSAETTIGFCVLGGMFAEGVDLTGDRLIGAVIIGVGLPGLSAQGDIIKSYFNDKSSSGYEYAYMYPGFNKVLQACGRVIRTPNDRGIVLLIDTRFAAANYRSLFPNHWAHRRYVKNSAEITEICAEFWEENLFT